MKRIVIAGIGTDVGKTVVSAIITEAINGFYWKPIQCGILKDREWIQERLSKADRCYPEGVYLQTPCSPHQAARIEKRCIDKKQLLLPYCPGVLVIEGTGGILTPINEKESWIDAALGWSAEWIIVHRHYLGSLNHFLLTLEVMKQYHVPLLGVIFNGEGDFATEKMLLQRAQTECLGRLEWQTQLTAEVIQKIAKAWHQPLQLALGL